MTFGAQTGNLEVVFVMVIVQSFPAEQQVYTANAIPTFETARDADALEAQQSSQ